MKIVYNELRRFSDAIQRIASVLLVTFSVFFVLLLLMIIRYLCGKYLAVSPENGRNKND